MKAQAKKVGRPLAVRILGRNYSISYDLANGDYGRCMVPDHEIEIADKQPLTEEQDTVLHEIMHAVWSTMDIGHREIEEHVVRKLATGIALVLKENPALAQYLAASDE